MLCVTSSDQAGVYDLLPCRNCSINQKNYGTVRSHHADDAMTTRVRSKEALYAPQNALNISLGSAHGDRQTEWNAGTK